MIINAGLYGADGLVFDLEDAVAPDRKQEARLLLAQAFMEQIVPVGISAVRINGPDTDDWMKDLEEMIPAGARIVRIPKVEHPDQIRKICDLIGIIEEKNGIASGDVVLQCILETPSGVENAFIIGNSSPRIRSYSFGAEDYCTSVGIQRGPDLFSLDYPRSRIASAAAAFGYSAIDTVWGFLDDEAGLEADTLRAKSFGFNGKSCIHPDQIDLVNKLFTHSPEEVTAARQILEKASTMSSGATADRGRMIDRPVILRAEKILRSAEEYGIRKQTDAE